MQGLKFDEGKVQWHLLPLHGLEGLVKVYEFGAKKYGVGNWKKGVDDERLFSAAMRHLTAYQVGEVVDSESGLNHLDHALWNILTLSIQVKSGEVSWQ